MKQTDYNDSLAIYIHWPFCKAKCPYCDFNSHVRSNIDQELWLRSYLASIDYYHDIIQDASIVSIFFGGGTPSLANPSTIETILNKISSINSSRSSINFSIDYKTNNENLVDCNKSSTKLIVPEITLEANPTSVEMSYLKEFKQAGINRISIGIQSLRNDQLKFLGRQHEQEEARNALGMIANIFDNYSFDLIYCLPNQTIDEWKIELSEALKIAGPHISLYQLTIENGTLFAELYRKGKISMPNEDHAALMYETTQDMLAQHNMPCYEISNHAKLGYECLHNIQYWQYRDYLGIGPGAHSRLSYKTIKDKKVLQDLSQKTYSIDGTNMIDESQKHDVSNSFQKLAFVDYKVPEIWLKNIEQKQYGIEIVEVINEQQARKEAIIMGLRMSTGINIDLIVNYDILNKSLPQLIGDGLLIRENQRIYSTMKGKLLLNYIIDQLTV